MQGAETSALFESVLADLVAESAESVARAERLDVLAGLLPEPDSLLASPFLHAVAARRRAAGDEARWLAEVVRLLAPRPAEPAPEPEKPREIVRPDREVFLRAVRLFELRAKTAELKAQVAQTEAAGFSADATLKEIERLKNVHETKHKRDGYVYGFAQNHRMAVPEWEALRDAYRGLLALARAFSTREFVPTEDDRAKWGAAAERLAVASRPCGADLTFDEEVRAGIAELDRVIRANRPPEPKPTETLATLGSIRSILSRIVPPTPAPVVVAGARFTPSDRVRLKADVARTKAALARGDQNALHRLNGLLEQHRTQFDKEGFVYGFSSQHAMSPAQWEALAEAYDALQRAIDRGVGNRADALAARAAVQALDAAMKPAGRHLRFDDDNEDLKEELLARWPRLGREPESDPLDAFRPRLDGIRTAEDATEVAHDALAAGVRPSDPRLREPLLDWTDEIADSGDPALAPLARELALERERREAPPAEEEEIVEDAVYLAQREAVREVVGGKRMLMVGGKPREDSRRAIEVELDLKEAVWPDADEHLTKPGDYDTAVDRADVVLKTRFCRRGYQRALQRAKAQGKPVAALTAGYNPRQVVRAMAEQWDLG